MSFPDQPTLPEAPLATETHNSEACLAQPLEAPRRAFLKGLSASAIALSAMSAHNGSAQAQTATRPPN